MLKKGQKLRDSIMSVVSDVKIHGERVNVDYSHVLGKLAAIKIHKML